MLTLSASQMAAFLMEAGSRGGRDKMFAAMAKIDPRQAQCGYEDDRRTIFAAIEKLERGFDGLSAASMWRRRCSWLIPRWRKDWMGNQH